MSRQSVLLLSDDAHFVRACADLDVDVTVVYGTGQRDWGMMTMPAGKRQIYVENSTNVEDVALGLYRADVDPASFDAIYSNDEGGVLAAAALGRTYGVASISPRVAASFRDKSLAKSALHKAGVDAARFIVVDDLCDLPRDFSMPFARAVLKPIAGGATLGASVVGSNADLQAAAQRARDERQSRTFILEEFISGDEWHLDGVVFAGELVFVSVGGYQKTCLTTISSNDWLRTFLFHPDDDAEVYERAKPFAQNALQVLGLDNGVFHMELFHDAESGRLVFGECAARRGGGLIEEEVAHQFGVSLATAAVHCALGVKPVLEPQIRPGTVGCVYLPYTPGTLMATPSASEVAARPNVEFAMVEWPIGFTMRPVASTIMKIGQAMLTAHSRAELFQRADDLVAWFGERTVILPVQATPAELRHWYAQVGSEGRRAHSVWRAHS